MPEKAPKTSNPQADLPSRKPSNVDLHLLEIGRRMTPAERLRWLDETVEGLLPWVGRAVGKQS
jgi:hypothetical protein